LKRKKKVALNSVTMIAAAAGNQRMHYRGTLLTFRAAAARRRFGVPVVLACSIASP
jgi:hypothetical protein